MASSHLVTHCGAREVSLEILKAVPAPPPTDTWFPVKHGDVVEAVADSLAVGGFRVERANYALSRSDARLFATLDLSTSVGSGVNLSVGVRNSLDKSLPLGFCAGSRVFVCDNLAFRSELLVSRKHTRNGQLRFSEAICQAVQSLHQFRQVEEERVRRFRQTILGHDQADSIIILRAYRAECISHRQLPRVIEQWENPAVQYDADPKSLWTLFNAFTFVLGDVAKGNPQRFAHLTMNLQQLLDARTELAHAA